MLSVPSLEFVRPETVPEAIEALAGPPGEAQVVAGGTDLVPNLKHGLFSPKRLVGISHLDDLREVAEEEDGGLTLGAGITLAELADHPTVRLRYPALARAAGLVAGPQLRNMGTLGGNLCLDTRCVYYNQTHFWREALGYCLKKDGTTCKVVEQGRKCVAAFSADTPGPLITYAGEVRLLSVRGERRIPVRDFFRADGIRNTVREHDELVIAICLPPPPAGLSSAYKKVRVRESIDFPVLSIAVSAELEADAKIREMTIVIGALGARPKLIDRVQKTAVGRVLDDSLKTEIGELVRRQCHPLTNINVNPDWRRNVLSAHVERALAALQSSH